MKKSTLFLSFLMLCLSLMPAKLLFAQESSFQNKWYIKATSEYHHPIWTHDFKNFLNQNASHVYNLSGVETFGWEVGMPIPTTDYLKIIASAATSYSSLLLARDANVAVRYILPFSDEHDIFSVDLGAGHQSYTFAYHDQLPVDNITMGNIDNIFNSTSKSFDIKQQLWSIHAALNYDLKISHHLFVDISLRYRVLMGDVTRVCDRQTTIDNFPTMSHHNFGINIGLSYYFDNL